MGQLEGGLQMNEVMFAGSVLKVGGEMFENWCTLETWRGCVDGD